MSYFRFLLPLFATLMFSTSAHALGFELGESKEELELDYDVSIHDHKTDRVTVVFTLRNEGRMKPLYAVDLSIPSKDGTGKYHLVSPLKLSGEGKAKTVRVHIHKDWLQNAYISLKTGTLDGKIQVRTWYYHVVPIHKLLDDGKGKKP